MSQQQSDSQTPGSANAAADAEVLSEEELEALQKEHPRSAADQGGCQSYDFRDPARILNGRLPGMDTVNESFVHSLEDNLQRLLRRAVTVNAGETLLSRQNDYLNALPLPASVQSVNLPSHDSTLFITFEGALVYACVDAYFGGSGAEMPVDPEREFSASERRVTNLLTQQVLVELKTAWSSLCSLDFASPQNFALSPSGSAHEERILVVTKFRIELQPGAGELHVAFPYALLDRLRPLLNTGPRNHESNQRWFGRLQRQVWKISVDTYSLFPQVEITVGELMALRPGDFIPIPEQDRVTVLVDEYPLYEAEPGNSNGLAAAKILSRVQTPE